MSELSLPQVTGADKRLTKKQLLIVDHIMLTGHSVIEASDALNLDRRNIYRTLDYPHVKMYLQQRTLDHIGTLSPYAVRTQGELLNSSSDHVRANVAENILDRQLGKPIMRQYIALQGKIEVTIDLG